MRKWLLVALSGIILSLGMMSLPRLVYAADDGVKNGNIQVEAVPGGTVGDKLAARAKNSWPWYVTRASGMVAAVALIILILSGIGQVTGYTYKLLDPLTAWASHRALGLAFGIAIFVHIGALLFDHFVTFSVLDLFVPWLSHYKPVIIAGVHLGSLYMALGILAFYLTWIVIVTSLLWVEKKPHLWKWIHLLSYVIIAFVFVHTLYMGTDIAHGIIRWLWILLGIVIIGSSVHRLWRLKNV